MASRVFSRHARGHLIPVRVFFSILGGVAVLTLLCGQYVQTQVPLSPKREVRAVWITTAAGLDWPKSTNRVEQQRSLRQIVADLKAAHFNTIIFQARARGDAYYRSKYEPWAENLTGSLGKDPGWDPLDFLLQEAHATGLEVHAWFNVYKIRGPGSVGESVPLHPARRFASWVRDVDGEGWVDPGVPEVRDYLVRVALDLIRHYDVDGINFDFIRYPGKNFPDAESFRRYGNGMNKDDWRRSNIDRFVTAFYDSAMIIKPMLKVGSAPLGVFDSGNGWGAYFSYYQDSQGWLKKRKHDYLSPQLYWSLGASKENPDFAELLRSWKKNSYGRQLWAGVGAYKPEVQREIPAQIDSCRSTGVDGQAFFRYEHVNGMNMFAGRYARPANIPPMSWKDAIPPLAPSELAVTELAPNIFHLEWLPGGPASDGDRAIRYNIYRSQNGQIAQEDARFLVAVTTSADPFFVDTIKGGEAFRYRYAVAALDKGNNESSLSNIAGVTLKEFTELKGKLSGFTSLSASVGRDGSATLIAYKIAARARVSVRVARQDSRDTVVAVGSGTRDPGTYIVSIPAGRLQPGLYTVQLLADDVSLEQPFEIR